MGLFIFLGFFHLDMDLCGRQVIREDERQLYVIMVKVEIMLTLSKINARNLKNNLK